MFACQWDETSQRFKKVTETTAAGEKVTKCRLASQVMVFSGIMLDIGMSSAADLTVQPYFSKTMVVHETDANTICESVLGKLPFNLESHDDMLRIVSAADTFILSCTMDRASANLVCARIIALACTSLPVTILPWTELCAAHGVALIKSKAPMLKSLSSALCSFTLWTKYA